MQAIRSFLTNRKVKTIVFSVLTALILIALVLMFIDIRLGLMLWVLASVPSLAIFLLQKQTERDEEVEKVKNEALKAAQDEEEPET